MLLNILTSSFRGGNGTNYTSLDLIGDEWVFNRSKSGETITGVEKDSDSLNGIRRMPYIKAETTVLTILMDDFLL